MVFFGPPGVGKGTVATRLAGEFNYSYVSSGDLLRDNVRRKTALGEEAKKFMETGGLVPDELVTRMVFDRLNEIVGGIFLDGYPRTIQQAEDLSEYLKRNGFSLQVLSLEAPDDFLMNRLSQRLICRECGAIYHLTNLPSKKTGVCDVCGGTLYQREDDRPEVVANRLAVYHRQSAPLRDYYLRAGVMQTLDGTCALEETLSSVRRILARDKGTAPEKCCAG